MTEEKLKKIYRVIRIAIFAIPAIVVLVGLYIVLFPIDSYKFNSDNPELSKFQIEKNTDSNEFSLGVFPSRVYQYQYVDLAVNFKKSKSKDCQNAIPEVNLSKTYQAFLFPEGDPIVTEDQLRDFLFAENKTKYPNGSLLHLKPTNEVFLISRGKRMLFPGPEIFQAFGYSFDNLTDVEQSDIDKFPNADQRFFLWSMVHPDGTIFQSYPSHSLYLVFDGKKHRIENKELLDKVWPENYTIPISDNGPENNLKCPEKEGTNRISCRLDAAQLPGIGRYYFFTVKFPDNCSVENIQPESSRIRFFSERSISTIKESLRNIVVSVLNRYFYKQ